jgi:hypothetical protein
MSREKEKMGIDKEKIMGSNKEKEENFLPQLPTRARYVILQ